MDIGFWLAVVIIVLLATGSGVITHFITENRKKSQITERIKLEKDKLKIIDNAVLMGYTPDQVKALKEMMQSQDLDKVVDQQQTIDQMQAMLKQKDEQIAAASNQQPQTVVVNPGYSGYQEPQPTTYVTNVYSNDNPPVTHGYHKDDYSPDVPHYSKEAKPKPPPTQKSK